MSDRVAVILDGKLRQIASPATLYHDPDDVRVAQFVGMPRINVFPAVATPVGIGVLGMPVARDSGLPIGTRLQAAIRPERLAVTTGAGIPGRIVFRENLGSDLFLHIALHGMASPAIIRCDPSVLDSTEIGATVQILFPAEHLLLFDSEGRRIARNG